MHNKTRINHSRGLVSIGDNTTDEGRIRSMEGFHQIIKLGLVKRRDSLTTTLLLATTTSILLDFNWLTRMVSKTDNKKSIASILHHLNNGVVQRILVLEQPSRQIVGDSGGIMDNSKMSIGIRPRVSLLEVFAFAKQVFMKFSSKGLISSFGEEGLLLKDGQKTHGLLKHGDTFLQVHAKVNIAPFKTLPDIFFLLQNKHVFIEELLELLIGKVNTNLLKAIVVKDLKASNVQATNVLNLLHGWVKEGLVTFGHNEGKETLIDGAPNPTTRAGSSIQSLTLGHPLSADL